MNIGYGRAEIAETLREKALAMAYYHGRAGHSSEPVIRLTDRVLRRCLPNMSRVFWGLQGSDAHIVTEADVEEMIARMQRAVDREVAALAAEGAWRPTGS